MRLAIDAMGNDRGPQPIVEGVKAFLGSDAETRVLLVGDQDLTRQALKEVSLQESDRLEIVHASQIMEMHDKVGSLREKRDSSIVRLVAEVKEGRADAMVALGNTAAAVGAACMGLRLLNDVKRAGIAVPMPTMIEDRPCVTIDLGANTSCKPRHLVDYGIMASIYSEKVLHVHNPRVGLLNVGEERGKGNPMLREAFDVLENSPVNFIGNVEGGDIFNGKCDVVVCDGFTGNVVLKAAEGLASTVMSLLKQYMHGSPISKLGGLLASSELRKLRGRLGYESYGGAPLLGINGVCIIGHGRSSAKAVYNALRVARESVKVNLNGLIHQQISGMERCESVSAAENLTEKAETGEQ